MNPFALVDRSINKEDTALKSIPETTTESATHSKGVKAWLGSLPILNMVFCSSMNIAYYLFLSLVWDSESAVFFRVLATVYALVVVLVLITPTDIWLRDDFWSARHGFLAGYMFCICASSIYAVNQTLETTTPLYITLSTSKLSEPMAIIPIDLGQLSTKTALVGAMLFASTFANTAAMMLPGSKIYPYGSLLWKYDGQTQPAGVSIFPLFYKSCIKQLPSLRWRVLQANNLGDEEKGVRQMSEKPVDC